MKKCLFVGTFSYAYAPQIRLIASLLTNQGYEIEYLHDLSKTPDFIVYDFIYCTSLLLARDICAHYKLSTSLLCVPAIYSKATCPLNDLQNIETIEESYVSNLLNTFFKKIIFLSEHDVSTTKSLYMHLYGKNMTITKWIWGLSPDEILDLQNLKENVQKHTFYFYIGTWSEKSSRLKAAIESLSDTSLVIILSPDIEKTTLNDFKCSTKFIKKKFVPREKFLRATIQLVQAGGIPFNVHHDFECRLKSTFNERSIKLYALGHSFITDNPFRLSKQCGLLTQQLGTGDYH